MVVVTKSLRIVFNFQIIITIVIVNNNPGIVFIFKTTITMLIITNNPIMVFENHYHNSHNNQ